MYILQWKQLWSYLIFFFVLYGCGSLTGAFGKFMSYTVGDFLFESCSGTAWVGGWVLLVFATLFILFVLLGGCLIFFKFKKVLKLEFN